LIPIKAPNSNSFIIYLS